MPAKRQAAKKGGETATDVAEPSAVQETVVDQGKSGEMTTEAPAKKGRKPREKKVKEVAEGGRRSSRIAAQPKAEPPKKAAAKARGKKAAAAPKEAEEPKEEVKAAEVKEAPDATPAEPSPKGKKRSAAEKDAQDEGESAPAGAAPAGTEEPPAKKVCLIVLLS